MLVHWNWSVWFVGLWVAGTVGGAFFGGRSVVAEGVPVELRQSMRDIGMASRGSEASVRLVWLK